MLRGFVAGVGAAIALAGVTGCYVNPAGRIIAAPQTGGLAAIPAPLSADAASVSIDGWPRDIRGTVTCTTIDDDLTITVGAPDQQITAMLARDASHVTAVDLGEVYGVLMGYRPGPHGGQAAAMRTGRSYTIAGVATGVQADNPMEPFQREFEIRITCP